MLIFQKCQVVTPNWARRYAEHLLKEASNLKQELVAHQGLALIMVAIPK
jgi:hypothetical protein